MFLVGVIKTFALYNFYTPKNCILEVLGRQMSLYSLKNLVLFHRHKRLLSGGEERGGTE